MATGRIGTTPVLTTRWSKAPAGGTTSLSGTDDNSVSLVYSVGYEQVYRNGVLLSRGNDYTATNGTSITLIDATITGDIIEVFANATIPLTDTYSQTVANGKFINNTLTTTTGDIIYASAANTPARLGIGSTGQVLKVSGGVPAWGADGGKVLQVVQDVTTTEESTTSTSYVDTALSIAITPSAATSKVLVIVNAGVAFSRSSAIEGGMVINLVRTSTQLGEKKMALEVDTSATENRIVPKMDASIIYLDSPNTTSATTYKVQFKTEFASSTAYLAPNSGLSSITLIEIGA